ncbi:MAG: extracellular solute-binding protein [Clostridia bacterium]|nr:extracellular solute-binding protein [Clostridia bacterium]
MKKILALVLMLCMLSVVAVAEEYREPITLTVFSQVANFAGEQSGWFAKEVKDRFNITLNFVSTNVDTNAFTAGVAAEELGDIICWGDMGEHFSTALQAELVMDMTDIDMSAYPTLDTYFDEAFAKVSDFSAAQGMPGKYGFSYSVAMENDAWAEITDPTYALQVRYDAWEKAGKPALTSLEDLPAFLKALQDAVPTTESGEKVYAYGGFGDWEDCVMKFTWDLMTFYGYKEADFLGVNYATGDVVNPLEDGSLYYRALKVNNELYRLGLFDPESVSQNFDTYTQKLSGGRYLVALWGWITGNFNNADRAAQKIGYTTFMFEDSAPQQLTVSTAGGNRMWSLGADCEYPERALELIEWLCTEEGVIVQTYGPKGLCWDYDENGVPFMTEFGWACQEARDTTAMPAEYGGGTFQDGESKFNHETIKLEQMIPGKTYSYSYKGWPCYTERYSTELSKAWSTEYANGAANGIELYRNTGKHSVVPATAIAWVFPDMSDASKENRALFAPVMKQGSWNCVYAESEEQFEQLWSEMVATCKSYGYDEYVAEKMVHINEALAACGIVK